MNHRVVRQLTPNGAAAVNNSPSLDKAWPDALSGVARLYLEKP